MLVQRVARRTFSRSVVILHDKRSVRGIRKDEKEYMHNPEGVAYPGTAETLAPAKAFLGPAYELPEPLILQALTHKSFAHAKQPYNERLAILGEQFLRMQTGRALAAAEPPKGAGINGLNFEVDAKAAELLSSATAAAEVCKRAGLAKSIFWKAPNKRGAATVYSKTVKALLGGVLHTHGLAAASRFVEERLLSGPYDLAGISEEIVHS